MKKILLFILIGLVCSCNPTKYIAKHPELFPPDIINTETIKTVTDSVSYTVPDSAAIRLLFECDSNNNVLMTSLNNVESKGVETKIVFVDGELNIDMYVDSIAVLNKVITELKSVETTKINPVNTVLKEDNENLTTKVAKKNRWLKIMGGIIVLLILLLLLLFKLK